jgi:thiamine-phosphate pyrophosphorylase
MNGLKLLISSDIKMAREINADGIHLPEYMVYNQSKINWKNFKILKKKFKWIVTVAAHIKKTLYKANQNYIDAAILSPIFPTKSHANTNNLGITKLIKWTNETTVPVYALGGIKLKNIQYLKNSGIVGFAFQRGY